jgi:Cu-processing system permease protein
MFIYNSRNYMEMLLCQPIRRNRIYLAFYTGITLPMITAFLLGTTIPFMYHGGFTHGVTGPLLLLLTAGVALNIIFIALAFYLALSFEDRVR